jgi:hypothetical protein
MAQYDPDTVRWQPDPGRSAPDPANFLLVAVDEYNQRAVAALERAQARSGAGSANAFARLLAERASGSPSASTYRRWIAREATVPAWALDVAAEVTGTTVDGLFHDAQRTESGRPPLDSVLARMQQGLDDLTSDVIDLYGRLGWPPPRHDRGDPEAATGGPTAATGTAG